MASRTACCSFLPLAFADCDFTCRVDLHDEYYEIDMPQFHWAHDDIGKWLEEKGGIVCENLLDYYQL